MTTNEPFTSSNNTPSIHVVSGVAIFGSLMLGACDAELGVEPEENVVELADELSSPSVIPSGASSMCGNGLIDAVELCDDGNLIDDDGCDASCQPSGIASMSTGDGTTCVVTETGNIKCWGRNDYGQLVQGDTIPRGDDELPSSSGFIELGGLAWDVRTNGEQTLVLMRNGTVLGFGRNDLYQLGLLHTEHIGDDEIPVSASVPIELQVGGWVVELAVGDDFGCARLDDGNVQCWGANDHGQLGQAHTNIVGDDEAPMDTRTVGLGGPVVDLAAGAHHACAILDGGAVQCWGRGVEGQLGYGNIDDIGDDELPVSAGNVELDAPALQLVAGANHTCARLVSGSVQCWGEGLDGQLGYGDGENVGDDETPQAMGHVPLGGVIVDLAAGRDYTCAVFDTGVLSCWGSNTFGQLGLGHTQSMAISTEVNLGSRQAAAVFIGPMAHSACVSFTDGGAVCWGDNRDGQAGQGHTNLLGDEPGEGGGELPDLIVLCDPDDDS